MVVRLISRFYLISRWCGCFLLKFKKKIHLKKNTRGKQTLIVYRYKGYVNRIIVFVRAILLIKAMDSPVKINKIKYL